MLTGQTLFPPPSPVLGSGRSHTTDPVRHLPATTAARRDPAAAAATAATAAAEATAGATAGAGAGAGATAGAAARAGAGVAAGAAPAATTVTTAAAATAARDSDHGHWDGRGNRRKRRTCGSICCTLIESLRILSSPQQGLRCCTVQDPNSSTLDRSVSNTEPGSKRRDVF